ncbi:hypothetical protein BC941DRAFT_409240 [Chlamydoabsidia padenii]|nr:hypothetical protein BC941DRAFT_409240 [Chlamydoabsidia padenii]
MPTINETTVSPSMPPPPQLLTQSFTPESTLLSPEYQQLQLPQQFQQQHSDKIDSNNRLQPPSYKGHRRRRSSSVPSLFHSVKKRIIQSSIVVPSAGGSNTNSYPQEPTYSAAQQQPAPINTGVPIHPLYYAPPQHTKPLPIQIQRNPAFHRRSASPTTLNQDQLDEKLLQVNFNDVTVAELKDHLRERNLSVAGRKAELTQRLYNERQQVHARRQQGKIDPQDIPTIASPVSLSNSPPSSVFSSSSLAEAPSPRPIQQLTHQLHDLDIQHSFSDYYHQPSLDTTPPSFKSPLSNHPVHWDGDNSMPLFYQF